MGKIREIIRSSNRKMVLQYVATAWLCMLLAFVFAADLYAANKYTITATAGSGGSISPSGAVVVNSGSNKTFTITPNTGYHIADVTVDGVSKGAITSYTFTNVRANHTIAASFAINTYTITTTAGSGGSISPSGAVLVNSGSSQIFTITPNTGYHVADVTVDGVSQGAITSYNFTNVTANHTIAASFAINTYTLTATAGSGGTVTPATATVNYGGSQAFAITPNTGYHVADVAVDGVSQGAITSYTFTNVTTNHTIAATFAINTYTITATAGSNGSLSPSGAVVVNYGGNQAFIITPNTGYSVANITVDGASQGAITSYTFTNVITNHTISATFAINTYTITATAGNGGTVTPSTATVNYGGSQSFSITPNTGYNIADVTADGISQGPITSYTFTNVTANHTIAATFAINTYTITATAGSGGSISPSGAVTVNYGGNQSFTVTPNSGYNIAAVTVDGLSQGAITSYTFTNISAGHTIAATFSIIPTTIALTIDSPFNGAAINRPDVMVTGTVTNPGGYETGVTVNGVAALVYGNQFVANHVPLQEGSNAITATATDSNGLTSTASVTVNALTTGIYIRLTADTESGISPLDATLRVDGTFSISNSTLSIIGPTQPEILSSSADQYKVRMTPEGIYYFTASATGPDGNPYQDTVAIGVMNLAALDNLLRGKWNAMTTSLGNQDVTTAVLYISSSTRTIYQQMYTAIIAQLPAMVATQTALNLRYIKGNLAVYDLITLENGEEYSYQVSFAKDSNGIWVIQDF